MYSLYAVRGRVSERCFKTVALFMQSPYHLKHHRVFQYQRFIVGKEDDAVRRCHDLHGDISFIRIDNFRHDFPHADGIIRAFESSENPAALALTDISSSSSRTLAM